MRIAASILAASVLAAAPAFAENDQVKRAPVPDWVVPSALMPVVESPSGLAFVRRADSLVHLGAGGQSIYTGYRIRILHANALQLGNIALAWNPAAGAPLVHAVLLHRGNETVDVLQSATWEVLRRENQLEAASLDGILTAVLRVPDLRVGDELEVAFTVPGSDPTLGASDAGALVLAPAPAPGRFRLGLSWDEGHKPNLKMTPDLAGAARHGNRSVTVDLDNPPMIAPPAGAPPRFFWQRVVEYSDFADWAAISRHFAPLYTKAATLDAASPLKAEVRRIAAAHSDPAARAAAALKLVQQEVRYVYVGLDGGNLTPAAAAETWQRRYGDCKGKTALLLALLAELGIEAEPVLVSNSGADDGLDSRLPSPRLFDHVLVRARVNGASLWLDGTLPPVAAPSADPVVPYRWVLPVTARGSTIERRQWRPAETPESVNLFEIDARAGFDKPARITSTTIVRGLEGLNQQVQFSAIPPAQLTAALGEQLIGDTWQTIDETQWRFDEKTGASILTVRGTGTVDWEDEGGAKELTLPGGGFNPPEKRIRAAGQDQAAPYHIAPEFVCHVTTVRLPEATKTAYWSFNRGFDTRMFGRNYYRAFAIRDGSIRMVRGSRVEQQEIDAASAKHDNERIPGFNNSMARITYDPSGKTGGARSTASVPATDEIDWSADRVPCLASTAID